jgi:glycosyltransferase involved in cell wall biosynthesis
MATVEALASGTPVVGTAVGATPEVLAPLDPRLVAASPDPAPLAAAVMDAIGFATTDEFSARCRAYAEERYALGSAIATWEEALEGACR